MAENKDEKTNPYGHDKLSFTTKNTTSISYSNNNNNITAKLNQIQWNQRKLQTLSPKWSRSASSHIHKKQSKTLTPMTKVQDYMDNYKLPKIKFLRETYEKIKNKSLNSKLKFFKEYEPHKFLLQNFCILVQLTQANNMTSSSSSSKQANPALQAMLQKGIDAYMSEKSPKTGSKRLTRSATKAPVKEAETYRSSTPPKNNRTKNAVDTPLPESDEEKMTDGTNDSNNVNNDTSPNKEVIKEGGTQNESVGKSNNEEGKDEDVAESEKVDENSILDDINNEHGPQAKLNKTLTKMSPEERMKSIRMKAKERAEEKEKALQAKKAARKATAKTQTKKQKKTATKQTKKASKKAIAEKALKSVEDKAEAEKKEVEDLTQDTDDDGTKASKEVITVDGTEAEDEDEIEEVSSSDDDNNENNASNPYSVLAQETRKRKSEKKEKKRLKALQRPYNTYYTLKLKVEANSNPAVALFDAANAWLTNIQIVDPSIVVYGYKDPKPTFGIARPADIPKGLMSFKEYFLGANARADEGHIWTNIWIGHALEAKDIYSNFKCWLRKNDTYMYLKKLQEKNTVRDYFLLWSSQAMSESKLIEATNAAIASVTNEKYKFAFPWAIIRKEDNRYARSRAKISCNESVLWQ